MTSTAKIRAVEHAAPASRRTSVVGNFVSWTGKVLRLLLASLIVSIAVEWIGMSIWWPELGVEHSRQMLQAESRFVDQNLSVSWAQGRPAAAVTSLISEVGRLVNRSQIGKYIGEWSRSLARRLSSSVAWRGFRGFACPYLEAARNIFRLYMIRLIVLCLAAPLFALLVCVGLVDGLVQRDLRRWGGGRESSYVYHYAKRSNLLFLGLTAIVYLAMPFSIHPVVILVPFAIACAMTVGLTASRFKKYL